MDKLAIFVEGFTEMVFVERLVEEIAGVQNVIIERRRIRGGSQAPQKSRLLDAVRPNTGQKYLHLQRLATSLDPFLG